MWWDERQCKQNCSDLISTRVYFSRPAVEFSLVDVIFAILIIFIRNFYKSPDICKIISSIHLCVNLIKLVEENGVKNKIKPPTLRTLC